MLLTTKGRYAVMAMADMASSGNNAPVRLASIAERQGIDHGYLEQIFIKLKGIGLVESVRGPGGGYRLSRDRKDITVAEIMAAVEESIRMTRCQEHNNCLKGGIQCITHHLWDRLGQHIAGFLSSVSLEDIVCKGNDLDFR